MSIFIIIYWTIILLLEKFRFSSKWKNRKKTGLLLQLLFFLLGLHGSLHHPHKEDERDVTSPFIVHLEKIDKINENYNRFTSTVYYRRKDSSLGKLSCYTYISTSIKDIYNGSVFTTLNPPKSIKSIYNPGSFDFAAFAKQYNIHYTLYINNKIDFILLTTKQNRLITILDVIRKWILETIKSCINDPKEAGLTEALLIGYKDDLDKSLQEQYTATGVSHIIAVSGMHLGLIFYILTSLIRVFARKKAARLIGLSFILPFLWAFALITGASASVLRSAVVFTIMILGNVFLKKAGSINALLASAFFLLVIQPNIIADIGFQLSYAAVLSIILFEPIISKWIYAKNKILVTLWSMITITIAAQILTTPIVLYHFKQFPVLFLITNLIAVPLSSLVLLLAIGMCICSLINLPTTLLVKTIHLCLLGMNSYIEKIAAIPFNSIQTSISLPTCILSYVFIIILTINLTREKMQALFPLVTILFFLGISHHWYRYKLLTTRQIIVTYRKSGTFIIHQHGTSAQFYCSKGVFTKTASVKHQIGRLTQDLGIDNWQITQLEDHPAIIRLNQNYSKSPILVMCALDESLQQLMQLPVDNLSHSILIPDGSNKLWKIRQWEKQAQELHLRLHPTQDKGAFILSCEHE